MNDFVRPCFRQRLLASDWLPFGFSLIWTFGFMALVGWKIRPSVDSLSSPGDLFSFVAAVCLAGMIGWLASFFPMWLTLSPILYHQALLNGGPFAVGDVVMILSGPHRGRVSRVDGLGQHETLRVYVGEVERRRYTDFFGAYQLMRVTPEGENVPKAEDEPTP